MPSILEKSPRINGCILAVLTTLVVILMIGFLLPTSPRPVHGTTLPQAALTSDFTWSPSSPTAGETVTFTATTSGGSPPYGYGWTFGDGPNSGAGNPVSHVYSSAGSFSVVETVSDVGGTTLMITHTVVVSSPILVVSISFSPSPAMTGQVETFTATVTGGTAPYSYNWTFVPDAGSATGNPVTHTFAFKGTHMVGVTVTDSSIPPITQQVSQAVTVFPQPLTVSFTFSPANPALGGSVTFTPTVSGGTAPYTDSWNFGDGQGTSGTTVTHTYLTSGTFTVMVRATDGNSVFATTSQSITVTGSGLFVDFGPTTTIVGNTTFIASIAGGTSPFNCSWSFGDGTPSQTGCSPTHNYASTGTFTATLTVTDSQSISTSATHSIGVQGAPTITKVLYKHSIKSTAGTGSQTFTISVQNPSSLNPNATITISICNTANACSTITQSAILATSSTNTMTATFTGPIDKYTFKVSLSYSATTSIPGGGTTTVVGVGNSVLGKFTIS